MKEATGEEARATALAVETGTSKGKPVLVVDDDQDFREGIQNLLMGEGSEVFTASNGQDALDVLSAAPAPGLILLDLMMPVMSGHQFLRAIETHQAYSSIPVVVLTAAPVTLKGVAGFLKKPPDLDELISIVQHYCSAP